MSSGFLDGVVVLEVGGRLAVQACGALLAELGATVVVLELPATAANAPHSAVQRAQAMAGKYSVDFRPESAAHRERLRAALPQVDLVLSSSDQLASELAGLLASARNGAPRTVFCDITAFGSSGPLAGQQASEVLLQALTGIIDTTGLADEAPTPSGCAVVEMSGALYALAASLAAMRLVHAQGIAQGIEIALYDSAVSTLTTFLSQHSAGVAARRIGNHHASMSPWNVYRCADGWLLLCTGSAEQWKKLCAVLGRPQLASDARYDTPAKRRAQHAEVDGTIEAWTRGRSVADTMALFNAAALPCGPVYTLDDLFTDSSMRHRGMVQELPGPDGAAALRIPGSALRGSVAQRRNRSGIPANGQHDAWFAALAARARPPAAPAAASGAPTPSACGALRVLEMGSYTTAPFCARQLGALGADVVKVEPPGTGDLSRALPPLRDGQSYFFTMSNSDKRSLALDLRAATDKDTFRALLVQADVLVENLRPGSLARLGFDADTLLQVNPRLVYCTITGFGNDSPLGDRAAMDTTIQGMSGMMDLTRGRREPFKIGISIADIVGGQFALAAILAALAYRDRTGRGQVIDLSMQDASAWLTYPAWNRAVDPEREAAACLVRCSDGYTAVDCAPERLQSALAQDPGLVRVAPDGEYALPASTRAQAVERFRALGIPAAPVLAIQEVAQHPQTVARACVVQGRTGDGAAWPLLNSPMRLAACPPRVRRALGAVGSDGPQILADWLGRKTPAKEAP